MSATARYAGSGLAAALGLMLTLVAGARWTSERTVHVAESITRGDAAPAMNLRPQQALALAGGMLEAADRRWPVQRDAAFARALLAAEHERNPQLAAHWLTRSEGRVHSTLRWNQLAANVRLALGDRAGAEEALSLALALKPGSPASHWRGLEELRGEVDSPHGSATGARARGEVWGPPEGP